MVQSTRASAPSSIGEPVSGDGVHFTSANLSTPRLAIVFDSSAWSAARKLTQNLPERWISGHAREDFAGMKTTSGGSSDTLENDWQVRPTGSPPDEPVTTVTPEANRPRTSRKRRAAATCSGATWTATSSPGRNSKSMTWSPSQELISSGLGQVSRASGLIPSGISSSEAPRSEAMTSVFHRVGSHWAPAPKSWPQYDTAVDSRATQRASSTVRPSVPNSTSKPPGDFT